VLLSAPVFPPTASYTHTEPPYTYTEPPYTHAELRYTYTELSYTHTEPSYTHTEPSGIRGTKGMRIHGAPPNFLFTFPLCIL
jgi:hypothetical protein